MNTRVSSITLALLLVINSVVIAETTTMFVRFSIHVRLCVLSTNNNNKGFGYVSYQPPMKQMVLAMCPINKQ